MGDRILHLVSAGVTRLMRTNRMDRSDIRRILLIKLDRIGDVVLALPAVDALHDAFPEAHIVALASAQGATVLGIHPGIERIVAFRSRRYSGTAAADTLGRQLSILLSLARSRFDLIVALRDSWLTLMAAPFISPRRTDRGTARLSAWFKRDAGLEHERDTNARIVRRLGIEVAPGAGAVLRPSAGGRAEAEAFRRRAAIEAPYVAIHAGGSAPLVRWREERFARLVREWIAPRKLGVLLVGGPEDRDASLRIAEHSGERIGVAAGELSLEGTMALLEAAVLFIGDDSGPMHLAAALGVPTVGIFGPALPGRFGPVGPRVEVVHHRLPCCPCDKIHCVRPNDSCIDMVSTEEVIDAVQRVLAQRRP